MHPDVTISSQELAYCNQFLIINKKTQLRGFSKSVSLEELKHP